MENIRNQAIRDGKTEEFNSIFYCPIKAKSAIERFQKENPEGRFRKKLIDWGAWTKAFGVRVAKIEQEEDVLMDDTDYIAWATVWRLMTREDARATWKELVSDPDHPGEGCGAERELYIVKEKNK